MKQTLLLLAALCCSYLQAAQVSVTVADAEGKAVPDAVVYAIPVSGQIVPKAPKPAQIEQVNKTFVPLVTPVQLGAAVSFPNNDTLRHHVYSFSPAKVFALKLYVGTPELPVVFDKLGEIVLGCNIHDQMLAYVYVVDTPYFGKAGPDGRVGLNDLVAGDYELRTWHPDQKSAPAVQRVKLAADTRAAQKVTVELAPGAAKPALAR